jgi:ubiquitin C-terminal hydrolase
MKEVATLVGDVPDYLHVEETNSRKNYKNQKVVVSFSRQLLDLLDGINNFDEEIEMGEENELDRRRYSKFGGFGRRKLLDPKPLLRTIGESNSQFRSKSFAPMEQQDAQELLSALLGVLIQDAELHASSDRRFLRHYQNHASDPQDGLSLFDFDSISLLQEEEDGLLTSAIANGNFEHRDMLSCAASTATIRSANGSNGLSIDCDGTSILSLSEFLLKMEEEKKQVIAESNGDSLNQVAAMKPFCKTQKSRSRHHQLQEEKKQDHIDCAGNLLIEDETHCLHFSSSSKPDMSTSMKILRSTISSITPSPLSGWLGSTIQCTRCKHVRPIQNAPFLDIPIVPTSVPKYLASAYHSSNLAHPNSSAIPYCTLDECLADFTSVERVQDVECRNCTIQREIDRLEEEVMMLRGAVETMEKRKEKKNEHGFTSGSIPRDSTQYLRQDLSKAETRLLQFRTMDPDEDDIFGTLDQARSAGNDECEIFFGIEEESNLKVERCDARKCLLLTRTPSILCCHVQRRYYDPYTNRMEKCIQFVEFPQVLDISPYCAYGPRARSPWAAGSVVNKHMSDRTKNIEGGNKGQMLYRLQSIIEHRGNAHGGHYISYRKDRSGNWFRISDDVVTTVPWRDVRTCQAYMLFYEAI